MTLPEILYRIKLERKKAKWRREWNQGRVPKPQYYEAKLPQRDFANAINSFFNKNEFGKLISEADGYINHQWFFFGLEGSHEDQIKWHLDPTSGKIAPCAFSFDISYLDPAIVGDIKVIWEKNRHHHLTVLAITYFLTHEECYSAEVANQLLGWVIQNPYLTGVNWISPLEIGIRLISWIWCERLLQGSIHYEKVFGSDSPLWDAVYQQQCFIEATFSRGSSGNNHLIGEMAGLFCSSLVWPYFDRSMRQQKLAKRILEREIPRQTYPSGINREMAFSYHIFVLEFALMTLLEGKMNGIDFSQRYNQQVRQMLEVIPKLTDPWGNLPTYGDGDEGMAVQLQARGTPPLLRLRTLEALVNNLEAKKRTPPAISSLRSTNCNTHLQQFLSGSCAFKDAGIYILRSVPNIYPELFVLTKAGPLGYPPMAAHGHADALSFTLTVNGRHVLVDPGTYTYRSDSWWRNYFRGTKSHNTIVVDDLDQAIQKGPFLWGRKFNVRVHKWLISDSETEIVASHDGYTNRGVLHTRSIKITNSTLRVNDVLNGKGVHTVALMLHFHPECKLKRQSPSEFSIQTDELSIRIVLPRHFTVVLMQGGAGTGWFSPRYGIKQKTWSIIARKECRLPLSADTTIEAIPERLAAECSRIQCKNEAILETI